MKMIETIRIAAILVMTGMAAFFYSCHSSPHVRYDLNVVKHEQGWGYEILRDHKPFIYQQYIPAIQGNTAFKDKRSAKKTGRLVISKLRHHQIPAVSQEELKELGVLGK